MFSESMCSAIVKTFLQNIHLRQEYFIHGDAAGRRYEIMNRSGMAKEMKHGNDGDIIFWTSTRISKIKEGIM